MRGTRPILQFITLMLLVCLTAACGNQQDGNDAETETSTETNTETEASTGTETTVSYEEGTSPADNIVDTAPAEKVVLVVSFGTSFNQSRSLTIGGIETALQEAYPDYQIRRAFTSQIIIDKLAERDGLRIDNIEQAMDRLVLDNVKEVIIQPTHVMSGYEYDDVIAAVTPYSAQFESFKIGKPLLSDDVDYEEVADLIAEETAAFRQDGTAIVLMGHGTEHEANAAYAKFQQTLTDKGYDDYIVGTVEAEPTFEQVRARLREMNAKTVVLRPLMVVAGDHANNDMAGDEADSWKTILQNEGYTVEAVVEGLGQVKGIQAIYSRHVQDAVDANELSLPTTPAVSAGVVGSRLKDGVYPIDVSSNVSMFKIVDCQLTVADNKMSAAVTLSGQGFGKLYMGTAEQALNDTEAHFYTYTENGERHTFTVPVAALDRELDCAGYSIRREQWYDHRVVFRAANIPDDAFLPGQADVTLTGGSGKASVQSPAAIIRRDGADYAQIVWSSPHYTYMIVDDVKYLPVNTGGNSAFEIPATPGEDIDVIACTTAMSTPKEISYTLYFETEPLQ